MAHRDDALLAGGYPTGAPSEVTVRLVDMEPVAGLMAALGRFCQSLDSVAYDGMNDQAKESLATVQSLLWKLEHSTPETTG